MSGQKRVETESSIIPVTPEVDPQYLSIEISTLELWSFLPCDPILLQTWKTSISKVNLK